MTNKLVDFMILAGKESQTIQFDDIHKAIHMRQKLYGTRTKIRNRKELVLLDQIDNVEIRLLDRDKQAIRLNGKDFKSNYESGLYTPCYLVAEPQGTQFNSALDQVLRAHEKAGTLPSQEIERQGQEMEREMLERMMQDATPDSNPGFMRGMEMLRRGPPKKDE